MSTEKINEILHERFVSIMDGSMSFEKALLIALLMHAGQRDKGGVPYILHCIHVAQQQENEDMSVIGVLHDTVEDTDMTIAWLARAGLTQMQQAAMKALTHVKGESYSDYIQRVKRNKVAVPVKIADLLHNSSLFRLKEHDKLTEKDQRRMSRYVSALAELGALTKW